MMFITELLGDDVVTRLGWVLVHFLWQGVVVGAGLWISLRTLRRSSASARYLASCAALALAAALPVATWVWLAPRALSHTITVTTVPVRSGGAARIDSRPGAAELPALVSDSSNSLPPALELETLLPLFVRAWLIGVIVLAFYRAAGWLYVQHLRCGGRGDNDLELPARLDRLRGMLRINRIVRIVHCPRIDSPAVMGVLKPVILLPLGCVLNLTPQQLDAILAHELAHVRRHDYLLNLIQTAIETVLFFHPAVWWIARCIRIERENACDDLALGVTGDRAAYAEGLTALEELRCAPTPALAARGGTLLARVRRVLRPDRPSDRATWWPAAAVVAIAIAALLSASMARVSAQAEPRQSETRTATIVCVDENGNPVEGAQVYLVDWFTGTGKAEVTAPDPVRSGPDGIARFTGLPNSPQPRGEIIAYARAGGKLAGLATQSPNTLGGRPLHEPLQLVLHPVAVLRGRITAPDGVKLKRPEVRLYMVNNLKAEAGRRTGGGHLMREALEAADRLVRDVFSYDVKDDGTVELTGIPEDAGVILSVQAEGLARELVHARKGSGDPFDFEIDLQPEGVIEGKIVAEAGWPALGMLKVEAMPHDSPVRVGYSLPFETETADDGSFRFERLPQSVYTLRLVIPPEGWIAAVESLRVGYGEVRQDAQLRLERGQLISGSVIDEETGKPLAGAIIGVTSGDWYTDRLTNSEPSNDEGRFTVLAPRGKVRLGVVSYPRGYSWDEDNPQHSQVTFVVESGKVPDVQLKLKQGIRTPRDFQRLLAPQAKVSGRLVDRDGKPISGITVLYRYVEQQPNGRDRPSPFITPYTDSDGRYQFIVPFSEIEHIVYLEEGPTTAAQSRPFVPAQGSVQIEDIVTSARPVVSQISGVLKDPRGQPVAEAIVSIGLGRSALSDRNGRFRFELYDADKPVNIQVQANSFEPKTFVQILPGTQDVELILQPIDPKQRR